MKHPKTTITGILMIVGVCCTALVALLNGHPVDMTVTGATIAAGVGLISAADGKKTS